MSMSSRDAVFNVSMTQASMLKQVVEPVPNHSKFGFLNQPWTKVAGYTEAKKLIEISGQKISDAKWLHERPIQRLELAS